MTKEIDDRIIGCGDGWVTFRTETGFASMPIVAMRGPTRVTEKGK